MAHYTITLSQIVAWHRWANIRVTGKKSASCFALSAFLLQAMVLLRVTSEPHSLSQSRKATSCSQGLFCGLPLVACLGGINQEPGSQVWTVPQSPGWQHLLLQFSLPKSTWVHSKHYKVFKGLVQSHVLKLCGAIVHSGRSNIMSQGLHILTFYVLLWCGFFIFVVAFPSFSGMRAKNRCLCCNTAKNTVPFIDVLMI